MSDTKSTFQFTVNPAQAVEFITEALFAGLVPMLAGSPGTGKSQIAKKIARNLNLELIDIRLSQIESVDFMGLPRFTADGKAEFIPFNIFPIESTPLPAGKDGFLLFCHHKDTEVLTKDSGFVKFSELPKDVLVAQYDMVTHAISYAKPEAYIEYHKKGRLVFNEGDSVKYAITEDHDLILQTKLRSTRPSNQVTYKRKPLEASISGDLQMPLAGYNEQGWKDELTYDDKLAIAFQADGSFTWEHRDGESCSISFAFSKDRKIEQFRKDFPQATETVYGDMTHFSMHKIPKQHLSKRLRDVFKPSDFTVEGCKAFLEYVKLWDGFTAGTGHGYGSVIWDNASVVQEFAILSGQKCNISTQVDNRRDTFSDYHKCHWYPRDACTTQVLRSQTVNDYDDMVYCLKMPKGTLVTRYKGSVLISGNCDELNSASRNVIAAAYRVILDKEVGQHKLHPNVAIVCAGNLASDKAIVNNMGTAMQSRLVHLVLETNFNGWLEEVAIPQNYDSRIIAYLAQYPNKLMDFNPDHKELTYCCPRSWEFMHRLITGKEVSTNKLALYAGTITSGVAVEFVTFCKLFDNLITIQQILANPETCTIPSDSSLRWATLTSILSNVTLSNFDTVATYADRFTMDFRVFFYRAALAKSPELKAEPIFVKRLLAISKYLD